MCRTTSLVCLSTTAWLLIAGCGDNHQNPASNFPLQPSAPVAIIRAPQSAAEQTLVILDGSGSFDADSPTLAFLWQQVSGPTVSLASTSTPVTSFSTDNLTDNTLFVFRLTVTDERGLFDVEDNTITIFDLNLRPIADAGVELRNFDANAAITLDGSTSFDPDGAALTYHWTLQKNGTGVLLTQATSALANVVLPDVQQFLTITFQLTVTDAEGKSASDLAYVTVNPVATHVAFVANTLPSPALRNKLWAPLRIEVQNASGLVITSGTTSALDIDLSLTTGTGLLAGTLSRTAADGAVIFDDVYYNVIENGIVLTATASGPGGNPTFVAQSSPLDVTWPSPMPAIVPTSNNLVLRASTSLGADVVLAGSFEGLVDFSLDQTGTLACGGACVSNGVDAFVARYNGQTGDLLWIRIFGGPGTDEITAVQTSTDGQTLFVGAHYVGSVNFAESGSTVAAPTPEVYGAQDVAVVRLQAASGNLVWVSGVGGPQDDNLGGLSLQSAQVVAVGDFDGTLDADPSSAVNQTLTSSDRDAFAVGLLQTTGSYVWKTSLGGTGDDTLETCVTHPTSNDVYAGGHLAQNNDAWLVRLNSVGVAQWQNAFGDNSSSGGTNHVGVLAMLTNGNLVAGGTYTGTGDFDPTTATQLVTSNGLEDVFLVEFTNAGAFVNLASWGGAGSDVLSGLSATATDLRIVGTYSNTVDFDPGSAVVSKTAPVGRTNAFALHLTSTYDFVNVGTLDSNVADLAQPKVISTQQGANSFFVISGNLLNAGNVDLDPLSTVVDVNSTSSGIFIAKTDIQDELSP